MASRQAVRREVAEAQSGEGLAVPGSPDSWRCGRREEVKMQLCESVIDIAAALFGVASKDIRGQSRSSHATARVRQIAMYLSHVVLGLSMAEVGRGFGRDRTTVMHACHLIEDMRDDMDFDHSVSTAERIVGAALRARSQI